MDEFYPGGNGSERIRVTRDKNTGQIIESLAKRRVADLEITSPKRKVDWRISINIEQPIGVSPPLVDTLRDKSDESSSTSTR